jgi:hypothetical protein
VVIIEHGEKIRQSKKVRPSEESGGNNDNHQRVRKKKNEGAWIFSLQTATVLWKEFRSSQLHKIGRCSSTHIEHLTQPYNLARCNFCVIIELWLGKWGKQHLLTNQYIPSTKTKK